MKYETCWSFSKKKMDQAATQSANFKILKKLLSRSIAPRSYLFHHFPCPPDQYFGAHWDNCRKCNFGHVGPLFIIYTNFSEVRRIILTTYPQSYEAVFGQPLNAKNELCLIQGIHYPNLLLYSGKYTTVDAIFLSPRYYIMVKI